MGFYDTEAVSVTRERDQKSAYPRLDFVGSGYRFYDSALGRWLSRDPGQEELGVHLYAFIGRNLLSRWDAKGLSANDWGMDTCSYVIDSFWDRNRQSVEDFIEVLPVDKKCKIKKPVCRICDDCDDIPKTWGAQQLWDDKTRTCTMQICAEERNSKHPVRSGYERRAAHELSHCYDRCAPYAWNCYEGEPDAPLGACACAQSLCDEVRARYQEARGTGTNLREWPNAPELVESVMKIYWPLYCKKRLLFEDNERNRQLVRRYLRDYCPGNAAEDLVPPRPPPVWGPRLP